MDRTQATALLTEFGKLTGIEDIQLDDAGTGTIVVDKKILVSIGFDEIAGRVVLMGALDQAAPDAAQMKMLLRANFLWRGAGGANFALTPKDDVVTLLYPVPADATAAGLHDIFLSFVEMLECWQGRLAATETQAEPAASPLPSSMWG